MAQTNRQRFLQLLSDSDAALNADFANLAARIRDLVFASADSAGAIPIAKWKTLQAQIAALIFNYFASMGNVYTLDHNGDVVSHSQYMRLLWNAITKATEQGVSAQAALMKRALAHAPDVSAAYARATLSPFTALAFDLLIPEAQEQYRSYVPQYEFTWADHKTMSDRVLAAGVQTRSRVNALTRELLGERANAQTVADTLTRYLTGTVGRPNKPYGLNGRFDAERLLGTEIVFAYNRSQFMSALVNPFTVEVDIVLSPTHRGIDLCDQHAAGSPYSLSDVPVPPYHSSCRCQQRFRTVRNVSAVIDRLRANAPSSVSVQTPLANGFVQTLLRGGSVHA